MRARSRLVFVLGLFASVAVSSAMACVDDAAPSTGGDDASVAGDGAGGGDGGGGDTGAGGDGGGGCAPGLTACSTGCVDLAQSQTNCGACDHGCNGGSCLASACGAYVVAMQPTTGAVVNLATDGTRVVWADSSKFAIEQVPATGGSAVQLAMGTAATGTIGSDLALAKGVVAYSYAGASDPPAVGFAKVDTADSGAAVYPFGGTAVTAVSLNPQGTRVFFNQIGGTQGSLSNCPVSPVDAGGCVGVGGSGRFLAQTAADDTYFFYDFTQSDNVPPGLYLVTYANGAGPGLFTNHVAASLATDGTFAYWTEIDSDGAPRYTLLRTPEATPNTLPQTVASELPSSAFATDGVNVYYPTTSAIAFRPVGGGAEKPIALTTTVMKHVAVGGGLLVWTDGPTIWGAVLPKH